MAFALPQNIPSYQPYEFYNIVINSSNSDYLLIDYAATLYITDFKESERKLAEFLRLLLSLLKSKGKQLAKLKFDDDEGVKDNDLLKAFEGLSIGESLNKALTLTKEEQE